MDRKPEMRERRTLVRGIVCIAIVGSVILAGCSRQPQQEAVEEPQPASLQWQTVTPEDMTPDQRAQHERCLAAVNSLASELMGELMAALDSGGPPEGIAVCKSKAPEVAAKVAEEYDLDIGRTSFALRNASNAPPAWAENLVTEQVGEPVFLAGPAGQLGALLPIRLKPECQMCHGPAETIADDVRAAIAEYYPEDQATGFNAGELRGWFWVEVPAGTPEIEL
jgi:hypothetical protein